MSNTAIVFTGTCRSLNYTCTNIRENLIDSIGDCDVFALISKTKHAPNTTMLMDIPQLQLLSIENEPEYDLSRYSFRPGFPPRASPHASTQIYVKMINQRSNANKMLKAYEKEHNKEYDRVIFSRLDVKYFQPVAPLINNLDMGRLYVPDFHNSFNGVINGYNDRFAISNRKNMDIYFNLPESVDKFINSGNVIDPETFLKWHMLDNGLIVEHIPVRFGRTRPDGTEIDIRLMNGITRMDS